VLVAGESSIVDEKPGKVPEGKMIHFRCPGSCHCGALCSFADNLANCTVACPNSGAMIRVPTKSFSERDWLESTDPQAMLLGLPPTVSARSLRLFALACCQRVEASLTHQLSRQALLLADRYSDGLATDEDMKQLARRFCEDYNARRAASDWNWDERYSPDLDAAYYMTLKVFPASAALSALAAAKYPLEEQSIQCRLLRCILGNPFRTRPPRPEAITPLAEQVYQDRWDLMPLLGEWLQEHGYWSEGEHCLDPDIHHVKGCWVVDWVTGRE
jgi:hypothetical protein